MSSPGHHLVEIAEFVAHRRMNQSSRCQLLFELELSALKCLRNVLNDTAKATSNIPLSWNLMNSLRMVDEEMRFSYFFWAAG